MYVEILSDEQTGRPELVVVDGATARPVCIGKGGGGTSDRYCVPQ